MLRIFKNFRKREVVLALFSVVFVVAQVWLELKLPDYMREITSLITTQDSAMHDILIARRKNVTLCVWQFIGNGTGSCLCITDCFEFQCNRTWKVI